MKKISVFLLAAMAMVSCGNSYKAQDVALNNENDSLNYAVGLLNGNTVKAYFLQNDSSDAAIAEFIDAMEKAYLNKTEEEELSDIAQLGQNLGISLKGFEKNGLMHNKAWAVNEKIFLQGFVNALHGDTTVMTEKAVSEFLMTVSQNNEEGEGGKAVVAKCPKDVKNVALKSHMDSINYAFGYMNGRQVKSYALANDTTGDEGINELIDALNQGLKSKVINPQAIEMAKNVGNTIREQEPVGLMGFKGVETNFDLIKQGFINGMYAYTSLMEFNEANDFLRTTFSRIEAKESEGKELQAKEDGERFLEENALRDEVEVTESGLQYEVLVQGKGPKPKATDRVRVHYEGTFIDGTEFDSSYKRGEPAEFNLNGVIAGWTEGLQLMPVGSKYKLYIPYQLGYGESGAGQTIPPYSALIFTVELLEIK